MTQLSRASWLLGRQGLVLEFKAGGSVKLLFGDGQRTEAFALQLSQVLLENVRSQPLPLSDSSVDEKRLEAELALVPELSPSNGELHVEHFQMARFSRGEGEFRN